MLGSYASLKTLGHVYLMALFTLFLASVLAECAGLLHSVAVCCGKAADGVKLEAL